VSFRAARNGRARDTSLAWKQLSRVDVTPGRSPIDVRLKVVTADGQTVTWLLRGFRELSAALSRLQLAHNDRTGPAASR